MSNQELQKEIDLLKENARLRAEMGNSLEGYLAGLKKITALQKELVRQDEIIAEFKKEQKLLQGQTTQAAIDRRAELTVILGILDKETESIKKNLKLYKEVNKETNKGLLLSAKGLGMVAKGILDIPNTVNKNSR
jgi:hypothetical protein